MKIEVSQNTTEIPVYTFLMGAKGDWHFQISDLVKNPDGTDF